jgi:hypothetical protein
MTNETPLDTCPLLHLERLPVITIRELRSHGVSCEVLAEQCRPGGPWRQLLPEVVLLRQGAPTDEERLHAAVLYAGRPLTGRDDGCEAMVTGLAALALHGFEAIPRLVELDRIDVLVPRRRRLRDAGEVRVHRAHVLPRPRTVTGVPCAPLPRAVADAVAELKANPAIVRAVLVEAVRRGHCDARELLRELNAARLLARPHVADAVDALLAEDRAVTEGRLYEMVRRCGLPDPVWNVELRLPAGPSLGTVDAYWPDHAVALVLDVPPSRPEDRRPAHGERLEDLGVAVIHVPARSLCRSLNRQAAVVRTTLIDAEYRGPHPYLVVCPH